VRIEFVGYICSVCVYVCVSERERAQVFCQGVEATAHACACQQLPNPHVVEYERQDFIGQPVYQRVYCVCERANDGTCMGKLSFHPLHYPSKPALPPLLSAVRRGCNALEDDDIVFAAPAPAPAPARCVDAAGWGGGGEKRESVSEQSGGTLYEG
jgi:hypothetical protein